MTPLQTKRKLIKLALSLQALADQVDAIANSGDTPLAQLKSLHRLSGRVSKVRELFADTKGALASRAKDDYTHEQIAEALNVSKPYVQQMVYRGRKV